MYWMLTVDRICSKYQEFLKKWIKGGPCFHKVYREGEGTQTAEINTKLHKQMQYLHKMYCVHLKFSQKGNSIERIGYKNWRGWKSEREKEDGMLKEQRTGMANTPVLEPMSLNLLRSYQRWCSKCLWSCRKRCCLFLSFKGLESPYCLRSNHHQLQHYCTTRARIQNLPPTLPYSKLQPVLLRGSI